MRTLLGASLAVLLVAAVTAQSSSPSPSPSQSLIDQISQVINNLGGFEGTIDKLDYITKLVKKAYEDDGIGGWMARNLIKMELNQLKEKTLKSESDMINKVIDQLESKVGLRGTTYETDPAEVYALSEKVMKAIAFIRQSMSEIVAEIGKAQKEHDEAAGKVNDKVMEKINGHIASLKDRLRGLGKKLIDKITGRDQTGDVYGDNGGIRYMDSGIYGGNGGIRYSDPKAYGDNGGIRYSGSEVYGDNGGIRYSGSEIYGGNGGIRYSDPKAYGDNGGIRYAVQVPRESYILSEMIKVAIQQLRERIFKYIELIGEAQREAQKAIGDQKERALKHLENLKGLLQKSMASLKDALLGRKTVEELDKEIAEEDKQAEEDTYAVQLLSSSENYILSDAIKAAIAQLREKIFDYIEQLGKARREVGKAVGEQKEIAMKHLNQLKEQLKKATRDLKDALLGKKTVEEIKEDLH